VATNLRGEENENDSIDVEFNGSKFGEDGNHWLQEAND
jgi:hypothetical protein